MENKKSIEADTAGRAIKAKQASTTSKDAVPHRRANIRIVHNVLLIWLDKNIDDDNIDCHNTVTQLEDVVDTVHKFTNTDGCIDFLTDGHNDKVVMIISSALCRNTVPLIHDIDQLDDIFILGRNKARHEQWAKEWPKIKGVFTEIKPICDALKQAAQQCEQNSIAISFMATNGDMSTKSLDQLDCSFMYTQIMKEILLSMTFGPSHIQEFITYCCDVFSDDKEELHDVKELEQKYRQNTPIWWYTCNYFLYSVLNRALRLMDGDTIIKMGVFLCDLHRHIEQLHSEQFNGHQLDTTFTVYHGQGLSMTDFAQMKKTIGGLMSFDNFLSASKDRDVSLAFAESNQNNPDFVGILFVIVIDPSESTTPFASITDASCFRTENEILFSMHTVFRIRSIQPVGENTRLFQVDLILTSDNDQDLRTLTDRVREETKGSTGWCRLGELLRKMAQFDKAEQIYTVLFEQAIDDSEKAPIYYQLGWLKSDQGAYEEAITFSGKVLETDQKCFLPNDLGLAPSYNNIGMVYDSMGEYSKPLKIRRNTLPSNHPDLGASHNNIGMVYHNMGEYPKALSHYEKDLEIRQKTLPSNHPDLGASHNNIGMMYHNMGEYPKALLYYEKALEISQKTLPSNHPDLGASHNNIGMVYHNMGEYPKALSHYEKVLEIRQQTLPPNHPDLGGSYNNIGLMYHNLGHYSNARSFYERAVVHAQHSLPLNHAYLQQFRKNLETVKKKL